MNIFPRGVAQGESFYDRINERKQLQQNITHTIHTVLIAPRRYGKTSLMNQVLYENQLDHVWIDFMTVTSHEDAQTKILQKVGELITELVPVTEKLKKVLERYFSALRPEIIFKIPGASLSLRLSKAANTQETGIIEALLGLDNLAKELGVRLVVVFDEFQEILRIDEQTTLQASIRHAVERSRQVTYLFSGSKHRPLRRMFNGKQNPLYALCQILALGKIAQDEYIAYLDKAAMQRFGKQLDRDIIDKILEYSDLYPKYINALCGALWMIEEQPTTKLVDELWGSYILSKKTDITEDLADLTLNQRRLLQYLCFTPTAELYNQVTLMALKMSQSSVQKAIEVLLEKDFVIDDNGLYKVLDVALISYFKMF